MPHILIVTTSADTIPANGEPTGLWLEELTTPYYAFIDAGFEVTIVSVKGGEVPIDPRSLTDDEKAKSSVQRYLEDADGLKKALADTGELTSVSADGFDAIFFPGGHGPMFDFPGNQQLDRLIEAFDRANKIVSAVCHGPVALIGAKKPDGAPFVAGKKVSAFTNSEEDNGGIGDAVPFYLVTRLEELGANYEAAPDFQPKAVRDGNLITGQNPQSAESTALLIVSALSK
ncbi:MAG TPA: glutamine amidotransferase [Erythrobacter sp.]|nr:glutamine amidotransferase [Erythrobacteraceae bacterium]QPL40931.1 type 1 glutamine amidotransferase domain-containing protein [Erythrobacter sp. A30-3]HAG37732.1 glutamine amidotransferase [Erythrobacter sp.]